MKNINRYLFILLCAIVLNANAQSVDNLKDISLKQNVDTAYVFVGGAGSTFEVWNEYIEILKNKDASLFGYIGASGVDSKPHNVEYMPVNANYLKDAILNLNKEGYTNVKIYAFSMGGLVAKEALLLMNDQLQTFNKVTFIGVSTPLGGFSSADHAYTIPGMKQLSKFFGYAMSSDIASVSDFIKDIQKKLPSKVYSLLLESKDDPVAQPKTTQEIENYEKSKGTFDQVLTFEGKNQHTFALNVENLKAQDINLTEF